MIDFYEGWDLRNRLIKDGYMSEDEDIYDGREMMMKIYELARKYYDWKPAEPSNDLQPSKEYTEMLELQTPTSRLDHIYDIAIDWDGYRTIRGLGSLINEIIECTMPSCRSEHDVIEEVKLVKMFDSVEDFLNTRVKEDKMPFIWNFCGEDVEKVMNWSRLHNYTPIFNQCNRATNGEKIGYPIIIKKEANNNDTI